MSPIERAAENWIKKHKKDWRDIARDLAERYGLGRKFFIHSHAPTVFYGSVNPNIVVIALNPKHSRNFKSKSQIFERAKEWDKMSNSEIVSGHKSWWSVMKEDRNKSRTTLSVVKILAAYFGEEFIGEIKGQKGITRWEFLEEKRVLFLDILPFASKGTKFPGEMLAQLWQHPQEFRRISPLPDMLEALNPGVPILAFGQPWKYVSWKTKASDTCSIAAWGKKRIVVCPWALTAIPMNSSSKKKEVGYEIKNSFDAKERRDL